MKDISSYLMEHLNEECKNCAACEEETIASEKDFKAWARAKFEEVYGDEFDEDKFKETLDGFLKDNKELVDKKDWGELVGMMNQSFAKK